MTQHENTDAIAHAGEIPADLRPHIEAPEDTEELHRQQTFRPGGLPGLAGQLQRVKEAAAAHVDPFPHMPQRYAVVDEAGRTQVSQPIRAFDMMRQVFDSQEHFQKLLGHDVSTMSTQDLANYVKDQVLALLDEGHEALAEVSWKPWAKDQFVNRKELGGELADILCFLVNLALAAGMTADDFYAAHQEKALRNIKRQEKAGGYSQTDGKCPTCRRAIDDLTAKGISTGNFGGIDFCSPECIDTYRANSTEKGI